MTLNVRQCTTKRDVEAFIRFPYRLYANHPHWVPPLVSERRDFFDREKNPFFLHSTAEYFIAEKNGTVVGRIAAIENTQHNSFHNERIGFWGCFECVDDAEVAAALFDSAREWVRSRGLTVLRGPANFSTNDEVGLLVDAFDRDPVFLMPYNPPYYEHLVEGYGFQKAKDLFAFWMVDTKPLPERLARVAERLAKRSGITLRSLDIEHIKTEVQLLRDVYNRAWQNNWGFVPMTEAEFSHAAKDFARIADPEMVLIAEAEGKPVAFALNLPDLSPVFKKMGGRLFPFGIVHFLRRRRVVSGIRMLTLGVVESHRRRGIDNTLIVETYRRGTARGYHYAELSWVLEDNEAIISAIRSIGGEPYKTYRMYDLNV